MLAPLVELSLAIAAVPPYADRRDFITIDGDLTRYFGLALMSLGAVLRVGPMFVLGQRFTWPLASQERHNLIQTGFYRFIRHPSYAGAFLGAIGWALVFRSGLGLILVALLLPAFLPVVWAEEALLITEFGDQYEQYRRRTWRLLPFVY
jgi:protein-S-isoprenylcysteine O-methyltransferase Ste14